MSLPAPYGPSVKDNENGVGMAGRGDRSTCGVMAARMRRRGGSGGVERERHEEFPSSSNYAAIHCELL